MIGSPISTLQYYMPQVHNVLANVAISAFLFGEPNPTSLPLCTILKPSDNFRSPNNTFHGICKQLAVRTFLKAH